MAGKLEDLFGAKFVLPEHRETYLGLKEDEKLMQQPVLEEDELRELAFQIQDSIQFDFVITISWWKKIKGQLGVIESARGWVKKIDVVHKQLKLVSKDEDVWWIPLDKITDVKVE